VFGSGIGKPMIATGNSLAGEYWLGVQSRILMVHHRS
jgi:hypothetical protein